VAGRAGRLDGAVDRPGHGRAGRLDGPGRRVGLRAACPGTTARRGRKMATSEPPRGAGTETMARYLIGIDLGTTNSALAYLELGRPPRPDGRVDIRPFPVPQLVAPGEAKERSLLPSFLYLP